jgi:NAD(P)-dependent dehydrogenase (short-subunit alcohol dehydrogenase family)
MKISNLLCVIFLVGFPTLLLGKTEVKDQVVLITGASGDIGLHTTKRLLAEGAYVAAQYNKRPGPLEALKKQYPNNLKLLSADFKDPQNATQLWQEAVAWKGHIDILINSAGIEKEAKTMQDVYPVMTETMAINYLTPVMLSTQAIAHFKQAKIPGIIINLGSRAAFRGMPEGFYQYADSKAALTKYTQQIAKDNAVHGITAVVIAPGPVEGQMFGQLPAAMRQQCLDSIPTKKPVTLDEVTNAIMFYATHQAPSGTGGVMDLMGASWSH